jgi:hypothetical protein
MATDAWLEFNGVEIVNLSRTAQLAETLGLDSVWVTTEATQWIEGARSGVGYDDISAAPWYDPDYPASSEFAGIIPLGFPGLDDSTTESATVEYITDGGRSGVQRNVSLPIVASVALMASTDRGAEYGKKWMDRILRASQGLPRFHGCSGVELRYHRYASATAPVAHRRQVRLTRAASVTRKRSTDCSVTWLSTFTLTCDDPYEYGEPQSVLAELGGTPVGATTSGSIALVEQACPVYDYTPVYDPLFPALIASPTAPDLIPAGWGIEEGMTFDRYWARIPSPEPSSLNVVPVITLTAVADARTVRVSIWPGDSPTNDMCDPLFGAVISYLPGAEVQFIIDGEQKAVYVWDGFSPAVRRADSLVYSPDAKPVEWSAFNDDERLMVTLDIFSEGSGVVVDSEVRLALSLVPKSD